MQPTMIRIGLAQMGPNQSASSRATVLERMCRLYEGAADRHANIVVFPELAFTTYFPKTSRQDASRYFEREMPNSKVTQLFEVSRARRIPLVVGYAEQTVDGMRFNTMGLFSPDGQLLHKYRKIHLPGVSEAPKPRQVRIYEPAYFDHGDLGLHASASPLGKIGLMICQDRRYPEVYRSLALDGAQIIVSGYNTPLSSALSIEQHELCLRSGAYANGVFVAAVAKAGTEDGVHLIGDSIVVNPHGQVIARSSSEEDEVVCADLNLAEIRNAREEWGFHSRRHPTEYSRLCEPLTVPPIYSRRRESD